MDLGLGKDLAAWPLRGGRGSWDGEREVDPRAEVRAWGRKDKGAPRSCPGTKQ